MKCISFIFNRDNLYFNVDKFDVSNNILYVTGLSGSGKSTYASDLASKYNAILFELDNIGGYFGEYKNTDTLIHKLTYEFLSMYPTLFGIIKSDNYVNLKINNFDEYVKWTNLYVSYLEEYANKNSDKLFIFEGTQIFKCMSPSYFKFKPLIIIRTSAKTSMLRRIKRQKKRDKVLNRKHFYTKHLWKLLNDSKRLHYKDVKCLNSFILEYEKE